MLKSNCCTWISSEKQVRSRKKTENCTTRRKKVYYTNSCKNLVKVLVRNDSADKTLTTFLFFWQHKRHNKKKKNDLYSKKKYSKELNTT